MPAPPLIGHPHKVLESVWFSFSSCLSKGYDHTRTQIPVPMELTESGISRLASVGSNLDAISSISDDMSLSARSNLIFLDRCLHTQWGLGQNVLLNWCPQKDGIDLLVVPHYGIAAHAAEENVTDGGAPTQAAQPSESFFKSLLSGQRQLHPSQMDKVARLLSIERTHIPLRHSVADSPSEQRVIERMIKRYSISYVPSRAVALFDIVGFGLLRPFEQMTQLNSLSYSLNSAQSKLTDKKIGIDFARTTTGDGFYVWNRDLTLDANINLYHFMHLALADNAIARSKARANTVPRLRACFHIGSSYEFHQAEGLNPTIYNYIVGDVTIELARMIERALPDQILVGEFRAEMPFLDDESPGWVTLDSIDFVARATHSVSALKGMELSGERVDTIKCYLTGAQLNNGEFTVRRIIVSDKHGISRMVYNSKANIYRKNADPILLGIEDRIISSEEVRQDRSEHVLRPGAA